MLAGITLFICLMLKYNYITPETQPENSKTPRAIPTPNASLKHERTVPTKKLSWDRMGQNCRRRIRRWPTFSMRWLTLARRRCNKHDPYDPCSIWLSNSQIDLIFPPNTSMWLSMIHFVTLILFSKNILNLVSLFTTLPFTLYVISVIVSKFMVSSFLLGTQFLNGKHKYGPLNVRKPKFGLMLILITCLLLVGTAHATRKVSYDIDKDHVELKGKAKWRAG